MKLNRVYLIHTTIWIVLLVAWIVRPVYGALRIDTVSPTWGELGNSLNVQLTGSGFDENTRVSMALDSMIIMALV